MSWVSCTWWSSLSLISSTLLPWNELFHYRKLRTLFGWNPCGVANVYKESYALLWLLQSSLAARRASQSRSILGLAPTWTNHLRVWSFRRGKIRTSCQSIRTTSILGPQYDLDFNWVWSTAAPRDSYHALNCFHFRLLEYFRFRVSQLALKRPNWETAWNFKVNWTFDEATHWVYEQW